MKKIGLFILLIVILAACGPSKKTMDIVQTKSIMASAHAAQDVLQTAQITTQGLSEFGHWQSLILMLLALFLVVPFFLVVFVFIRCLTLWKHFIWRTSSGLWIGALDAQWKKYDEPDLYQQIQLDQQWLFSRLLSQNQEEANIHDLSEPPTDWWS